MANPNFDGLYSSNNIWRDQDETRCITDDLDAIEANVAALQASQGAGYTHPDSHPMSMITGLETALAAKAEVNHNHDTEYISKDRQMTADNGHATIQMDAGSADNLLDRIAALPMGVHTFYSGSGNTGNPKTVEGWRGFIFKTSANQGFVQAYGSVGSVYTNYLDSTNGWRGWKAIFDCAPAPLWTGSIYPIASHTVTPSKPLSQCTHGWLLLWSDYDPGTGEQNYDFATTMIPKRAYTGQAWNGEKFICDVPSFVAEDPANDGRVLKYIQVYDDKIVGHTANSVAPRNDVVLRAVYEY